jgi:NitT/TauT family transport system substrate-binding protein
MTKELFRNKTAYLWHGFSTHAEGVKISVKEGFRNSYAVCTGWKPVPRMGFETVFNPISIALFASLLLLVIGCEKAKSQSAPAPLAEVRLGYFANLTHAQAVLGVASGDYAQAVAPAKLSTKVFNAGPAMIEALFAGEIDVAYVGPGPALNGFQKSRGQGLRVIAGGAANGVVIVARKDSGINTLADLKGKKLATPQMGNTQDISARHFLASQLQQTNLSNVMPIANAEQAGLMARGQIDAAWAPEPWGSVLVAECDAKIVAEEKDLWPGKQFGLTVVITTPEFLKSHPEVIRKLLEKHVIWTNRLSSEPGKYVGDLEKGLFGLTKKKLPAGVLASALPHVKFTVDPLEETFTTMAQWSYDLGLSQQRTKLEGLFDTTILKTVENK